MRIGLISDTHIFRDSEKLPTQAREALTGVDLIFHAGDIALLSVLDWLEAVAPVLAARGNEDMTLPEDPRLKKTHLLTIDELQVGLIHGLAYPYMPLDKNLKRDFGSIPNVVVFGDTHQPTIETHDGVLLVNPGSPTFPVDKEQTCTVGMLEIIDGKAEARIIRLP